MFATLLGRLPRPPLPADADARTLVAAAFAAQTDAGLEPLVDGGLWGDGDPVEQWAATASLTDRAVKQVITGPWTAADRVERDAAARADRLNAQLRELAAIGCPLVEIHEPAAATIGTDPVARRGFVDAQRRLLDGVPGMHVSLAITGGSATAAGIDVLLAAPYASLALDLITAPDHWELAVAAPPSVGIVAGALTTRDGADHGPEVLLYAIGYAASTGGRGPDRVGIATAGSMEHLPWATAEARMRRLGEVVRLAAAPGEVRARAIDPRAVDIRSAALGGYAPRRKRTRPE
jgi:methionine synthase II (cobalamin-independent)